MSDDAKDWGPHCGAHWTRDEEERAAVVKHLRSLGVQYNQSPSRLADAIEAGVHVPCAMTKQELDDAFTNVHDGWREGQKAERAAVVKYLRKWAAACPDDSATHHAMLNAAGYIEHGEHVQ